MQVPPAFSACKVGGRRAYEMARKGEEVPLKAKLLRIDEIELLDASLIGDAPTITLRIVCSKGTYIRALARDIGLALGSGAHLTALRRTQVGDVRVENCLRLEDFEPWLAQQRSKPKYLNSKSRSPARVAPRTGRKGCNSHNAA